MNELVSKMNGTRRTVVDHGEALVAATRGAGKAFVEQTARAGRDFLGAARSEANGWTRYFRTRLSRLRRDRGPWALEHRLLAGLDRAVSLLGRRIQARLAKLDGARTGRGRPKAAVRGRRARPRRPTRVEAAA